jgi:hypothetical protein
LLYEFKLDDVIPKNHLLHECVLATALADLHQQLKPFYSEIGRPSADPELMDPNADRGILLRYPPRTPSVRRK